MYLNSIYNLNWSLLNLIGSRGIGKTHTAANLLKQLSQEGMKCAICINDEFTQEHIWYDYFIEYQWYRNLFVLPLSTNNISIYYPKTIPEIFEENFVWFDDPTDFTLAKLNTVLLTLTASQDNNPRQTTKMISTFSLFGSHNGKVDRLLKYPDAQNVFCYGGDYLAELLSGKLARNIYEIYNT
jgi:hypothetical protein